MGSGSADKQESESNDLKKFRLGDGFIEGVPGGCPLPIAAARRCNGVDWVFWGGGVGAWMWPAREVTTRRWPPTSLLTGSDKYTGVGEVPFGAAGLTAVRGGSGGG